MLQPWSYRRGENNRFFGGEYIGGTRAIQVYKDEMARRETEPEKHHHASVGGPAHLGCKPIDMHASAQPKEYIFPPSSYDKAMMKETLPQAKYAFPPTTTMGYGWDFGGNAAASSNPVNPLELFGLGGHGCKRGDVTRSAPEGYPAKPAH